jgi:hypothetical protein
LQIRFVHRSDNLLLEIILVHVLDREPRLNPYLGNQDLAGFRGWKAISVDVSRPSKEITRELGVFVDESAKERRGIGHALDEECTGALLQLVRSE